MPSDIEWDEASPPRLTFPSKTAVGIVAGAHRLRALVLFCDEADTLIKAAEEYLSQLEADLKNPGVAEVAKQDLALTKSNIEATLERLVQERDDVANWPTLVYKWGRWWRSNPIANAMLTFWLQIPSLLRPKMENGFGTSFP